MSSEMEGLASAEHGKEGRCSTRRGSEEKLLLIKPRTLRKL